LQKSFSIGFAAFIAKEWLDEYSRQLLADTDKSELRIHMDLVLQSKLSGKKSRHNTLSVLTRIFENPLIAKRDKDQLCKLLSQNKTPVNRQALYWAFCISQYPFFMTTVEHIGRLLNLQESFERNHIKSRLFETFGEKRRVEVGLGYILQSLVDWKIIGKEKTVYKKLDSNEIDSSYLRSFMVEAFMTSRSDDSIILESATESPALFPFRFSEISLNDIESNEFLDFNQHGMNQSVITLTS